jgi:hypothetical protein
VLLFTHTDFDNKNYKLYFKNEMFSVLGVEAHIWNPSFLRGHDRRIMVQDQ